MLRLIIESRPTRNILSVQNMSSIVLGQCFYHLSSAGAVEFLSPVFPCVIWLCPSIFYEVRMSINSQQHVLYFPPWKNYKENRQTLPCPKICSWFSTQPKQPFSGIIPYFRNHRGSKSLVPEKSWVGEEISTISTQDH